MLLWGEISGVKLPIIIVGVKIGSSTLMGVICSSVIVGVKIGSSAIVGGNFGSKATYYNCGGEDWK